MNQAYLRSGADYITFVPFNSCQSSLTCTEYSTGSGTTLTGKAVDLLTYPGYQTAICAVGIRDYTIAQSTNSSEQPVLTAYFQTDTSSGFGGSTTLGSTFTMNLMASSAQSSEEGVLVASVDLNRSDCYRYIRACVVVERSSGDGDGPMVAPVYVLSGRDVPGSTHNVQYGGAASS